MSCANPTLIIDYGIDPVTGKHRTRLVPRRADLNLKTLRDKYGDMLILAPCGHCLSCIQDYRQTWATRILLEASLYPSNCFITLTYREACLPSDMRPYRPDFQKFFKRLRKAIGQKCRVFYCGEVGKEGRPHYHAIIFGYDFPDKVEAGLTPKGSLVYRSKLLESLWPFGFSSIGEVEPGSACYVAQYCDKKKLSGIDDGSFLGMSRRPGIGCDRFNLKWFKSDTIYCALGEATIPRFFHKMLEGLKPEFYQDWKQSRKERCSQLIGCQYKYGFENEEEALKYEENYRFVQYIHKLRSSL